MPFWERATIAAVVIVAAVVLAKLADAAMRRVQLRAGAETRYRVLRARRAEMTVQLPLSSDLEHVIGLLGDEIADQRDPEVFVSGLDGNATITVRALAAGPSQAERLQHDLRLRAHRCLRSAGLYA